MQGVELIVLGVSFPARPPQGVPHRGNRNFERDVVGYRLHPHALDSTVRIHHNFP